MKPSRQEWPVIIVNVLYLSVFSAIAIKRGNTEFLMYAAVVLLVAAIIFVKQPKLRIGVGILWGLTAWGLMHMSGGLVPVGDGVLYEILLLPIVEWDEFKVFRYDQFVHAFGFGVATLLCHHVLRRQLRPDVPRTIGFWLLVLLMGCGVGAVNEMVEFAAVIIMPETGVGGYENTLLDLVFNAIGATIAVVWLMLRSLRADLGSPRCSRTWRSVDRTVPLFRDSERRHVD